MSCNATAEFTDSDLRDVSRDFHAEVTARSIDLLRAAIREHEAGAPAFAASEATAVLDELSAAAAALIAARPSGVAQSRTHQG